MAAVHLKYLNPLPSNLGEVLRHYEHVVVPELNLGQLVHVLRDRYLVAATGLNKIKGLSFKVAEIENGILSLLAGRRN